MHILKDVTYRSDLKHLYLKRIEIMKVKTKVKSATPNSFFLISDVIHKSKTFYLILAKI